MILMEGISFGAKSYVVVDVFFFGKAMDFKVPNFVTHPNGVVTHRRLRLPKVPQFRDWCTFKHIPHSTFRVLNLGIGLGFHVCTASLKAR